MDVDYGAIRKTNGLRYMQASAQHSHHRSANGHADSTGPSAVAKDPVCGMTVSPQTASATSTYREARHLFCSLQCKEEFDAAPERFAATALAAESVIVPITKSKKDVKELAKGPICGMTENTAAGYRLAFEVVQSGVVPRQPPQHSTSMHHEPSLSEATRHIAIVISDAATGEQVSNADVSLHAIPRFNAKEQELDLNAMQWNDGIAYGTYFRVSRKKRVWLLMSLHRRANPEATEAFVDYPFPADIRSSAPSVQQKGSRK